MIILQNVAFKWIHKIQLSINIFVLRRIKMFDLRLDVINRTTNKNYSDNTLFLFLMVMKSIKNESKHSFKSCMMF